MAETAVLDMGLQKRIEHISTVAVQALAYPLVLCGLNKRERRCCGGLECTVSKLRSARQIASERASIAAKPGL
jgi:hypothetical protein